MYKKVRFYNIPLFIFVYHGYSKMFNVLHVSVKNITENKLCFIFGLSPFNFYLIQSREKIHKLINVIWKIRMDNLTLIRTINNDLQAKEIYGIVHDIQKIAS